MVDGDIVAFADDTTIIVSAPSLSEAIDKMKKAVQQMELFCKDNNLALSPEKFQLLAVGVTGDVNITIGVVEVKATEEIKLLGVKLDRRLSWEAQARETNRITTVIARNIRRALRGAEERAIG